MNGEESQNIPDAEFLGQAGVKVEGQTRLEAAYGSSDGDEQTIPSASVAGGTKQHEQAHLGTVFDQSYQPWRGSLNPRWARNWAILRHHVYGLFSKGHRPYGMATKLILFAAFLISLGDLGMSFISAIFSETEMHRVFGISKDNLYGHVLGFWPRNAICFPIIAALLIGGIISEDRMHGTSAIYFSRPLNRIDYTAMKFLSVAIVLFMLIVGTLGIYYTGDILMQGEGWAFFLDTFPIFLGAALGGTILVFTYSSIGLALSSVSRGKFFPAVALLGIFLGMKLIAFLIYALFERSVLYLLSPYDCVAHVGQTLVGTTSTYDHPWTWSLMSLVVINAIALYILASRVSSMEVTRE
jgi:ABC-type transport system involved in multi-copper enzyme maturation permease subunit